MLLIESSRVEEEFLRIVEGLDAPASVVPAVAKSKPWSDDGDDGVSRQEEMEPLEDDDLIDIDIDWP
ncbi:hypothetical protein [Nocardiopsis baichengensis]|uniref:hypothetical protein n=1 Tax=Nocardiopsis baichengensis TaxID=280240 RepID=UPI000364AC75|nr:hypothetical protein [Nocardiopsis baichengensis]